MVKTRKSGKRQTKEGRTLRKISKQPRKPTPKSLLDDIREVKKAIVTVKKVQNLTGARSILTALYGEKRYAENLLRTKRLVKSDKAAKLTVSKKRIEEKVKGITTKSEKLKRGWRFIDAVKKNYSNDATIAKMSKKQLRSEFKKFRQGRESKVPDIAWYNPSP